MDGCPCGRAHTSTISMEEAGGLLTLLGAGLHLLPMGRVQLIAPSHSSPQQHFDGRAQDPRESRSFQTILYLGPLSFHTPFQYLCLPPGLIVLIVAIAITTTVVAVIFSPSTSALPAQLSYKPLAALTHEELAVELQAGVPISWGSLGLPRELIHLKGCFFNVPFCPHMVPPIVVKGSGGLHRDLTRPIPHIKGKGHFCRGWK